MGRRVSLGHEIKDTKLCVGVYKTIHKENCAPLASVV